MGGGVYEVAPLGLSRWRWWWCCLQVCEVKPGDSCRSSQSGVFGSFQSVLIGFSCEFWLDQKTPLSSLGCVFRVVVVLEGEPSAFWSEGLSMIRFSSFSKSEHPLGVFWCLLRSRDFLPDTLSDRRSTAVIVDLLESSPNCTQELQSARCFLGFISYQEPFPLLLSVARCQLWGKYPGCSKHLPFQNDGCHLSEPPVLSFIFCRLLQTCVSIHPVSELFPFVLTPHWHFKLNTGTIKFHMQVLDKIH